MGAGLGAVDSEADHSCADDDAGRSDNLPGKGELSGAPTTLSNADNSYLVAKVLSMTAA